MVLINDIVSIYDDPLSNDIQMDIVSPIRIRRGFLDSSPTTRVASGGSATFTLKNGANAQNGVGTYTPGSINNLTTFHRGSHIIIRVSTEYGEDPNIIKFEGWIENISVGYINKTVDVICYDWLYYAGQKKLPGEAIELNSTIALGIRSIERDVLPDGGTLWANGRYWTSGDMFYDFEIGDYVDNPGFITFPVLFDVADNSSYVSKELNNQVLSELGYLYLGRKRIYGYYDTNALILETRGFRDGTDRTNEQIPMRPSTSTLLIAENDDEIITEDGDNLVLNEYEESILDNEFTDIDITSGDLIYNEISAQFKNRYFDDSYIVLSKLNTSSNTYYLGPLQQLHLTLEYTDDSGNGTAIYSSDVISPIATTDYLANSKADGTGTNLTANLSLVADIYNSYTAIGIHNDSSTAGCYITLLQVRGKPLYVGKESTVYEVDTNSQDNYGLKQLKIVAPYISSFDDIVGSLTAIRDFYKDARTHVSSVTFLANSSDHLSLLFLYLDVGNQVRIVFDDVIDAIYYIDYVDITVEPGLYSPRVIVTWNLREDVHI